MFKTTALDSVANEYVDKNVGASIPGTRLEADDRNIIQDELVAIAEELGITLDATGTVRNQLRLAMTGIGPAFQRAKFEYNDADQIDIGAAMYMCKDKYCFWTSTLTSVATGAAGGAEWWYVYLDYSAITGGTEITNTELIWSTTAPTFNDTYRQWMNGDDRCIFAVLTDAGNNIEVFYHDGGDLVKYDSGALDLAATDIDDTWTDVIMTMPAFSIKATTHISGEYVDGDSNVEHRTNGSSGAGFAAATIGANSRYAGAVPMVITDDSQTIEVRMNVANGNKIIVSTTGWFFPTGM